MALINCSISTESVTATAGTTDLDTQTLVITPDLGYVVSAAAFTNNTSGDGRVNSITLADSTIANAVGNVVNVVVDLTDSFAMPSANSNITIDIDGRAIFPDTKPQGVNGTWDAVVGSGVTPVTSSGNAYSGSGSSGAVISLFTQTFTCASGKFFTTPPSVVITTGNASDYNIHPTNGYTGVNGQTYHTSITYTVSYTMPSFSVSGDNIDFSIPAAETIPVQLDEIVSYSISTTPIAVYGEGRVLRVHGTVGATFSCAITNEDTYYYNFTTDLFQSGTSNSSQTIGPDGFAIILITFPAVTDDDTYTITFTATGSSSLNLTQTHPIVIQQLSQKTISWSTATASGRSYTALPTFSLSNPVGEIISSREYQSVSLTITDDVGFKLLNAPLPPDTGLFTNTNIGDNFTTNSDVVIDKITTVPAYSYGMSPVTSLVVTIANSVYWQGTTSSNIQLNLDNFINIPPVANALSTQQVANNTATTMQLVGTDSQGHALTYSIVSQGSKGSTTVVGSTGVATYTPTNSGSVGGDSFTFKVNDGTEDSNTATALVNIASGTTPPLFNSTWAWNDSEQNNTYALISTNAFKGTPAYTNSVAAGSSAFKAIFTSWALDTVHTGLPSYIDNIGDFTINYRFKYGATVLDSGDVGINSGTSSVGSGPTADLYGMEVGVSIPSSHNSGNGLMASSTYIFEWRVRYDDISQ